MIFLDTDSETIYINKNKHCSYTIANKFKKSKLTPRETECLFYFVRGQTAKKIASVLSLSKRTVETHLSNIKSELDCETKADLIEYAIENRFIDFIPENIYSKLNISMII